MRSQRSAGHDGRGADPTLPRNAARNDSGAMIFAPPSAALSARGSLPNSLRSLRDLHDVSAADELSAREANEVGESGEKGLEGSGEGYVIAEVGGHGMKGALRSL